MKVSEVIKALSEFPMDHDVVTANGDVSHEFLRVEKIEAMSVYPTKWNAEILTEEDERRDDDTSCFKVVVIT